MLLSRRAKRGSWYLPLLARFIKKCAIHIHRPRDLSDPSFQVVFHNRDIVSSMQTASSVQSIPLHSSRASYIGKTTARYNLISCIKIIKGIVDTTPSQIYPTLAEW